MTRKEDILNQPYKDNGAYRVPEGYFADLNKRIMARLPAEEKSEKKRAKLLEVMLMPRMKYAAAACMTGLIVGVGAIFFNQEQQEQAEMLAENTEQKEYIIDEYSEDCMEYAMLNNEDMYLYLAEQ